MNYIDIIIIVILGLSFFRGYKRGLIGMLAWLVGMIVGIWLAGRYYQEVAVWLHQFIKSEVWATTASFAGIVLVSTGLIGGIFSLLSHFFNLIPFVGFVNRILGGALALIESILIIGLIVWFIALVPADHSFVVTVKESRVANACSQTSSFARWLLPAALRQSQQLDLQAIGFPSDQFNPEKYFNQMTPEQRQQLLEYLQSSSVINKK